MLVLVVSTGATIEFLGMHARLQDRAESVRNEWAYYDEWAAEQPDFPPLAPSEAAIKERLLTDALTRQPLRPPLHFGVIASVFDRD
jgi:hypothetical protein